MIRHARFRLHSFLWTKEAGIEDLEPLGLGFAFALSNTGHFVGEKELDPALMLRHAFLWTESGGLRDLGALPGSSFSQAFGVTDFGQVVGSSTVPTGSFELPLSHPFVWTEADGMQDLAAMPPAVFEAEYGGVIMNDLGEVLFSNSNGDPHFLWTESSGLQELDLGGLSPGAMNDSRQVVGSVAVSGSFFRRAAIWTATDGVQLLGNPLPGVEENCAAGDINNNGEIVGNCGVGVPGGARAMLWVLP